MPTLGTLLVSSPSPGPRPWPLAVSSVGLPASLACPFCAIITLYGSEIPWGLGRDRHQRRRAPGQRAVWAPPSRGDSNSRQTCTHSLCSCANGPTENDIPFPKLINSVYSSHSHTHLPPPASLAQDHHSCWCGGSQWSSHRPRLFPSCPTVSCSPAYPLPPPHTLPRESSTDPVSDPPEDISLPDFIYDAQYRVQKSDKTNTFTCGLTGRSVKSSEAKDRVEAIAKALSKRTGWVPQQEETEWEKIACIYSINAVSLEPGNIIFIFIFPEIPFLFFFCDF